MSTISIIGTGGMATAVAGRVAKAGHSVEVLSRDTAKSQTLAKKLGAGATMGTYGARPAGDIVILAVPYAGAAEVVAKYGDALAGKIVVDITNPVAPDLSGLVTPQGSSGAQEIAKGLPRTTHVVKAFNTIFGTVLSKGSPLDAFFAADDTDTKVRIKAFLESLGLRPLHVGGLQMAQTLEAAALMLIGLAENGPGSWDLVLNLEIG